MTYDSTTGRVTQIDLGGATTYTLTSEAVQGLATSAATSNGPVAVLTEATRSPAVNRVTTFTIDPAGRLVKELTPDGGTQTWQRDDHGQVVVMTDEMGRTTDYTYQYGSGDGNLTEVVQPDGGVQQFMYNSPFNEVTAAIDPLGLTTTYYYNSTGDLTETVDPLGRTTEQTWSDGLLQSSTDGNG